MAPTILTVTLNSAIDQVLLVDAFNPGSEATIQKTITCVGGKGLDSSVALRGLGVETYAIALLAGEHGRTLEQIAAGYGISIRPVWVEGETRVCYVVAEKTAKRVSHLKAGLLRVTENHLNALKEQFTACLSQIDWALLAGSLPAGVHPQIYGELVDLAHRADKPALVDSWGPALLASLPARPEIVKLNAAEFRATFPEVNAGDGIENTTRAAVMVKHHYCLPAVVVTCGAEGIAAATPEGAFLVAVPPQDVVNAAGAGDAASAALAWRLALGEGWAEALRWAGAVSAAGVLTEATGEVSTRDVTRILPAVSMRRLE